LTIAYNTVSVQSAQTGPWSLSISEIDAAETDRLSLVRACIQTL